MTQTEKDALFQEFLEKMRDVGTLADDYNSIYTGAEIDNAITGMDSAVQRDGSVSMTGELVLSSSTPSSDLVAASKGYVDANGSSHACSAGIVFQFSGPEANIPMGAMKCDGRALNVADYPDLHNAIGDYWNTTHTLDDPGAGKFRIPLITWEMYARAITDDNYLGLYEESKNRSHTHTIYHTHTISHDHNMPDHNHSAATGSRFIKALRSSHHDNGLNWGEIWPGDDSWAGIKFVGDDSGAGAGAGLEAQGNNSVTVNNKTGFKTNGSNTANSGSPSNTSTGTGSADATHAQPQSVGVYFCVWDGTM